MNLKAKVGSAELLLGSRYLIIRELGRGGFGHTYLAEDTHRFNELCVLKEFIPQVEGEAALRKAKQLFEREAGVLYQLKHPQIPQFRELLRVQTGIKGRLFLVQDYVQGPTYRELLYTRKRDGESFSETEAIWLLEQLLPVLDYIHSVGVIHRDIAPDNLILRNVDGLPILIDFGGVKQLAVTVGQQLGAAGAEGWMSESGGHFTRLGKVGYAPEEQIESGIAHPSSDLYGLAATVLTLLTGQEPQDLYDRYTRVWHWRQVVMLDPQLGAVLDRMLAPPVGDRYPSAQAVMQALQLPNRYGQSPPDPTLFPAADSPTSPTLNWNQSPPDGYLRTVSPPHADYPDARNSVAEHPRQSSGLWPALLGLMLVLGAVCLVWWVADGGQTPNGDGNHQSDAAIPAGNGPQSALSPQFSSTEQARKQKLRDRQEAMGIDNSFFVRLTDQVFYEKYPNLKGQRLTDGSEDAPMRLRWENIAADLLDTIETHLSSEAIRKLGSYDASVRDQWRVRVNQIYVSSLALYDLADAQFFPLFPEQRDQDIFNRPVGQIWHGLADDGVNALESGDRLEEVQFESGAFSHTLSDRLPPFQGNIYLLYLSQGQLLRLNLQASAQATQLSMYLPSPTGEEPFILADAKQTTWSDQLTQSGYYEVVIVSTSSEPISYELSLSADNVQSIPQ